MGPAFFARLVAPVIAVFALTAAVHRGDGYQINFPDAWIVGEKDANGITTASEPGGSGANCNIENKKLATLDGYTQDQLNAEFSRVYTAADWSDFLASPVSGITVISGDVRPFGEFRQQIATLRIVLDSQTDVTLRYGFYTLPGRIVMTGCYARTDLYPAYAAMYDTVIKSALPF